MIENNRDDPEWDDARAIWVTGKIYTPAEHDSECDHFLSDLKLAVSMFTKANRIKAVDQEREWNPDEGARLCRELLNFLYRIDDVAILRIVRTSKIEVDPLLARMISDLGQLERIFRNTLKLPKVRKRKHEIDDVLILKLADTLSAYNALILIQEFGCAVVKTQGHLGNAVSE